MGNIAKYQFLGVAPQYAFHDYPDKFCMAVRPDWPELVSILNKGISSFSQNEIDAIVAKWIHLPVQKEAIELTSEERAWLKAHPRIVLGGGISPPRDGVDEEGNAEGIGQMDSKVVLTPDEQFWLDQHHTVRVRIANVPPYMIVQDNQPPAGISIDYLKEISRRTGIRFDYDETDQSFADFLKSMKAKQGPDLGTTIVHSPEREPYLSFSEGYIESPLVILARSSSEFISDISGLIGKKVSVIQKSHVHRLMIENHPEIELLLFGSPELALQALATGQVDACIGNLTTATHIIHRRGLSDLHVVAPTPFGKYVFTMANRKDWPELTSIIDKVLNDMSADEHSAIQGKYMQLPFARGLSTVQITKCEYDQATFCRFSLGAAFHCSRGNWLGKGVRPARDRG